MIGMLNSILDVGCSQDHQCTTAIPGTAHNLLYKSILRFLKHYEDDTLTSKPVLGGLKGEVIDFGLKFSFIYSSHFSLFFLFFLTLRKKINDSTTHIKLVAK